MQRRNIMTGETNLATLIASMDPILVDETYIFATIPYTNKELIQRIHRDDVMPMASFTEKEGYSVIMTQTQADRLNIYYEDLYTCLTLNIHSSLDAVGLTAAISNRLTEHNISANVVAAYFHDHVFVAKLDAEQALSALKALSAQFA